MRQKELAMGNIQKMNLTITEHNTVHIKLVEEYMERQKINYEKHPIHIEWREFKDEDASNPNPERSVATDDDRLKKDDLKK